MDISLEDLAPDVPVVSIKVSESFNYGPTVLQPTLQEYDETSKNGSYSDVTDENGTGLKIPPPPPLDVLEKFTGTFKGFGFNTIFRPLSRNPKTITQFPKTPTDPSTSNLLQLNLTGETQVFGELLKDVPNRGLFDQADIDLIGLPYTQSIVDAMPNPDGTVPKKPPNLHFEPGLWMRVPQVEDMPELAASFCRMGSIPHGTTINAQGFRHAITSKGAPDIDPTDITPLLIEQVEIPPINEPHKTATELEKKRFDNQDADKDATRRLPQDLSPFIANGTITQKIIDDPNTILRQANEGKDIIENSMFIVSTNAPPGAFGGGTSNIGFNIGSDEGKKTGASREKKSGNANAVDVTAQYWVSKIRAEVELDPSMRVGQKVSPASQGPRDAVPEFYIDKEVEIPSCKKTVTVAYTQIQYSQMVMLDFNGIKWPHVTVATLAPIIDRNKPTLSSAMDFTGYMILSGIGYRNRPVGTDFIVTHHATSYDYISPLKLDLIGHHVLITGAAHEDGVGFATARAFARAGASFIACCDIHGISDNIITKLKSAASLANRKEPLVLGYKVDIASQESVKAMYESIFGQFNGRLDILVNNAAYMEPYKPFLESDPDTYWRTWEVNIHGLFNMARVFLPLQLSSHSESNGSCIMINVSSSGALSVRPGSGSYRTSKLAVLRWTESLQVEYGEQGLLAFCVNPGAIKTKITEGAPDAVRNALPHRPDVAGDTIAWLASERREWLGGRYMSCPWDMEELIAKKDEIVKEDKLKLRMVV
ncbi:hypothetical protein NOF04DRAFT_1372977 [Fusarium oxysporum II5]|nr:hypothetical protein NOF04DRAFT_1372977 [Fusarium oxysporum II5]